MSNRRLLARAGRANIIAEDSLFPLAVAQMDEAVELTRSLVSIPSPLGKEAEIGEYILRYLSFCREVQKQEVAPGRFNIIAKDVFDPKRPTVLINGHIDTVEPVAGWEGQEYTPLIRGRKIYGLGAADMKAGVAIALCVFKAAYGRCNANIILDLVVDEEGISRGAFASADLARGADICLIPEPSCERVGYGSRGRIVLNAEIFGRSAHGARPHLGISAIDEAAKFVTAATSMRMKKDKAMGKGSVCILKIESGVESLSVPEYCRLTIDRHYIRGENEKGIISEFQRAARRAKMRAKVGLSVQKRVTPYLQPYICDLKNPLVKQFLGSCQKQTFHKPQCMVNESVGDYNVFGQTIPTLIYGPRGACWHAKGEHVMTDSIARVKRVYLDFLAGFNDSGRVKA